VGWGMESGTLRNGQICYSSFERSWSSCSSSGQIESAINTPGRKIGKRIMCMYNEPTTVRSTTTIRRYLSEV